MYVTYLKGRFREREEREGLVFQSSGLPLKWQQRLGLEARSFIWVSHMGVDAQILGAYSSAFPGVLGS